MAIRPQRPLPEQQQNPYEPPGPPKYVFEQFQGVSTSTTRPGVDEKQAYWLDGLFPLGFKKLRCIPGVGAPLWSVTESSEPLGTTISFYDFGNVASEPYCIAILSNGSIYVIKTTTGLFGQIAPAGTILNPSRLTTGMTQYGSQYIIIVSQQTDGYFIWDGATFYGPGAAFGGDFVPTGLSGNAVEIYAGRVWVANNATIIFSSPGSVIDFTTGSGGGSFTSSDSFLRVAFSELVQSNGFLYLVGDSSLNYISGVQTSGGSPPVTTFTNQNADPEVGTPWPSTVGTFGRNILFANSWGVHVSYGAAVTKISDDLDGVYATVPNFGGVIPSSAKAILFSKKIWCLLLPIIDPYTGDQTNKLLIWDGKRWFSASQDSDLIYIQHQEITSVLIAYGTDGTTIWPLFTTPSSNITKVAMSKFWDDPGIWTTKATNRLWGAVQYYTADSNDIAVSVDNENGGELQSLDSVTQAVTWFNDVGDEAIWVNASFDQVEWTGAAGAITVFKATAVAQQGVYLGMTFTTNCPDLALIALAIAPEVVQYRG